VTKHALWNFLIKRVLTFNVCYDNKTSNEVVIIWPAICHICVTLLCSSVLGSGAHGNKACLNFCFVILWSSTSMFNELLAFSTEISITFSGTGVLVNNHTEHSHPIIPAKSVMENHVFVLQFRLGVRSH